MKILKHLVVYSLTLLLFTNNSCKKPEVPTGDNTFSCYIDGELFVPKTTNDGITGSDDGLSLYQYENRFTAFATDKDIYTVYFNIANWGVGTFPLTDSNGLIRPYDPYDINHAIIKKNGILYLSKVSSGIVTFIEANHPGEVNGTFEFTLYNENNESDIIYVTNGKFND